jgi:hypothetical protein
MSGKKAGSVFSGSKARPRGLLMFRKKLPTRKN